MSERSVSRRRARGRPPVEGMEQDGLADPGQLVEDLVRAEVEPGAARLCCHEVDDGECEHEGGQVQGDLLTPPVEDPGDRHVLGVLQLAKAVLDLSPPTTGRDHLGGRPVAPVSGEDAFFERLVSRQARASSSRRQERARSAGVVPDGSTHSTRELQRGARISFSRLRPRAGSGGSCRPPVGARAARARRSPWRGSGRSPGTACRGTTPSA